MTLTYLAAIEIILACLAYTYAVGHSFFRGLDKKNLTFFSIGLILDFAGTAKMFLISGQVIYSLHSLFGFAGLIGMGLHTFTAVIVHIRCIKTDDIDKKQKLDRFFHFLSPVIYLIWLTAFITGIVIGR